ncbi:MAG: methionine--tRNA ligase [Actinobacteria bacterium]|nr:methionine--tRNA ligase [Actinomycetota bacterium]
MEVGRGARIQSRTSDGTFHDPEPTQHDVQGTRSSLDRSGAPGASRLERPSPETGRAHPETILVAVAWPYASGPRHLGHVAGFGIPSDIFARYHRMKGSRVLMVSGTDEHGTPNLIAAERAGLTPKAFVDNTSAAIRRNLLALGLSYDLFTRTTTPNHGRVVQDVFATLYRKGYLLRQTTMGAFSPSTGRTLPDRYIEGTCPRCGFGSARGDQCDGCGNQLDPTDLIDPRSRLDGKPPEFRETEQFFLDLPAFAEAIAEWIRASTHWRANVRNFSLGLIEGLRARPITRDLDWGVPVPIEGWAERDGKRIYVWFDAVIGYLSASTEWAEGTGDPEAWRAWWQGSDARAYYFMGKDNIVFHSIIWPSILLGYGADGPLAAGRALNLPYDVVASEYLTMEGRKFSSSRDVAIYVDDFLTRYDPDALRYYLTAAGPETHDTDFTWSHFVQRTNDELIANWGNLVHRTLTTTFRTFGEVPTPEPLVDDDQSILASTQSAFAAVGAHIEAAQFRAALAGAMEASGAVNQYLTRHEPWKLAKTDRGRSATVLFVALQCIADLRLLFAPFLPFSSQRLHEHLGFAGSVGGVVRLASRLADGTSHEVITGDYHLAVGRWESEPLPVGRRLAQPSALFRKLDEDIVAEELARMKRAP